MELQEQNTSTGDRYHKHPPEDVISHQPGASTDVSRQTSSHSAHISHDSGDSGDQQSHSGGHNHTYHVEPGSWQAVLTSSAVVDIQQTKGFPTWEFQALDSASRNLIIQGTYRPRCTCSCGSGQECTFTDHNGSSVLQLENLFNICKKRVHVLSPLDTRLATLFISNWANTSYDCVDEEDHLVFRVELDGHLGWTESTFNISDGDGCSVGKFLFRHKISGSHLQFFLPVSPESKAILLACSFYVCLHRLASPSGGN